MRSIVQIAALGVLIFMVITSGCSKNTSEGKLISYVDPFIGTGGHGHTYPGATVPFGSIQLSPDTRLTGWDGCSGYHYSDNIIYGFSHTHLSGTGVPDYCDILFMPFTGTAHFKSGYNSSPDSGYGSRFSHKREEASPGFYSVFLDDYKIKVDLTATKRVGFHRYSFLKGAECGVIIDLKHRDKVVDSGIKIVSNMEIEGFRLSSSWADDQYIYFVARFSKPFTNPEIVLNDSIVNGIKTARDTNIKTVLHFSPDNNEPLLVKVGISAVDIEGARKNLDAEIPGWDFEEIRADAEDAWEKTLGVIETEGGSKKDKRIFYTAIYHSFIAPNLFMDVDNRYRGTDHKIHYAKDFTNYTIFSLWDTFRAEHPLFTIIQQKRTLDFIKTFLNQYKNGGFLPMWELAGNYTHCMIGYHAVPVIVDAYVKGIGNFDTDLAMQAMKTSSNQERFGIDAYVKHGYIPLNADRESVSKTLEYSYDDWCIAQMAKALGRDDDYRVYIKRAQYYKNIFDQQTGFMRARMNGMWSSPFDPTEVNFNFTEGNSWQYSFFVPQDVSGLISLLGGKELFSKKLDGLFSAKPKLSGREQPDITGLIGQYAHGNEPSHHIAYLYNYAGKPWKTQEIVHKILSEMYNDKPDGLSGNEDCGQMSAWYILSALGFYPVVPGSPVYAIGTPVFKKAVIHLENGRTFTVEAKNLSGKNFYIKSAMINGQEYSKSFITHDDIMKGGVLSFTMSDKPNKKWGTGKGQIPVSSINNYLITRVPYVKKGERTFRDSMIVELAAPDTNAVIYYTLDGSTPTKKSMIYKDRIILNKTTTLRMAAFLPGKGFSFCVTSEFLKITHNWKITLNTLYDSQYTAGGKEGLIDQLRGGNDFMTGLWQGYSGRDLDAVVDLGSVRQVNEIGAGFLQKQRSWIWMPKKVEIFVSNDGENFSKAAELKSDVPEDEEGVIVKDIVKKFKNLKTRYVRIRAQNIGDIPKWHPGTGNKGWLFTDEIIIR